MPLIIKSKLVYLTLKHLHGYSLATTAKNSSQNWSSEFKKMHSRIFIGFFYARKLRYVMAGCIEEPSGSPCSFLSGKTNSVQPATLQLVLKVAVSKLNKETLPCL